MARSALPPGFRFHPTDVELVLYYLKRKVMGKPLRIQAIAELDLYKYSPWDLPEKSGLQSRDLEWYFFCPRDRKYANGPRTNRATEVGYWKTTGRDRAVCNDSRTVGMKKTLIFHLGRAPHGARTNWVMHEYRLETKVLIDAGITQDTHVLCKIFEKSGVGPKNGEQHVAPYREEEWEDHMVHNSLEPLPLPVDSASPSVILDDEKITVTEDNTLVLGTVCDEKNTVTEDNSLALVKKMYDGESEVTEDTNLALGTVYHGKNPVTEDTNLALGKAHHGKNPATEDTNLALGKGYNGKNGTFLEKSNSSKGGTERTPWILPRPMGFARYDGKSTVTEDKKFALTKVCTSSLQSNCENTSSAANGLKRSLLEDVDMDSKSSNVGGENDPCHSGNYGNEETCVAALLSLRWAGRSVETKGAPLRGSGQQFEGQPVTIMNN